MMGLPGKDEILSACRGFPLPTPNPMLDAAAELAILHEQRERTQWCELEPIDWQRARTIQTINRWVVLATPVPVPAARLHTHTMGQVVDQLAQLTVETYIALADAPEGLYYDALDRLNEAADAYQDFADELCAGIRRMPEYTSPC